MFGNLGTVDTRETDSADLSLACIVSWCYHFPCLASVRDISFICTTAVFLVHKSTLRPTLFCTMIGGAGTRAVD